MSAHRERLPDHRPAETWTIGFEGARLDVTIGTFPDGRPGEIFIKGPKVGSAMATTLDDAAVLVSLLLQNGLLPADIARAIGIGSPIGAVINALASEDSVA